MNEGRIGPIGDVFFAESGRLTRIPPSSLVPPLLRPRMNAVDTLYDG